jgi:hypothetical protein
VKRLEKTKRAAAGEKPKALLMFFLMAPVKRAAIDAKDYAQLNWSVEVWVKATRKDAAVALAKRTLDADGWEMKNPRLVTEVTPGFARIGSMMDPPAFSEDEADEWTEQYFVADVQGFACSFTHCAEPKRKPVRSGADRGVKPDCAK